MYKKILFFIAILLIVYLLLVLWRIPYVLEQQKTQEVVELINSKKITLEDVTGANLPPTPDPSLVDATVEGIDANSNGIRDDVELTIFERYPTDLAIRAAYLQYAMALQLKLMSVFNSETWVASAKFKGKATSCVADLAFSKFETTKDQILKTNEFINEIKLIVLNTDLRKDKEEETSKFEIAYSSGSGGLCDVELLHL